MKNRQLVVIKKFMYLRVVYICMNDVDKEEDYPEYVEYMYDFYRQYDNDVGFKMLQNNMRVQGQKLNKLKNISDFGGIVSKIYQKLDEKQRSQPFLSDDEFNLLNEGYHINWLRSSAEFLYKFTTIFFLPDDINSDGNIKLKEICDRLGYTHDQFLKLKKYFFVDIRNALSHVDYKYELENNVKFKYIIYNTKNEVIKLDHSKMMRISEKMVELASIHVQLIKYYK